MDEKLATAEAIKFLAEVIEKVAYGRAEYPGSIEKIGMELERVADAIERLSQAVSEHQNNKPNHLAK